MTTPTKPAVTQDPGSWQRGYADGQLFAGPGTPPPGIDVDALAYQSGMIEGSADRQAGIERRKRNPHND